MADINISKYTTQVIRVGSTPSSPGFAVDEGQDPVDPSGNPQTHLPVTIAAASTGLSITESQVLGGAGTVAQYIRGDGSLADFPESSGGGSSVSYYLNGSVSQGTIGGVAYLEMNKVPILGAGTDFTRNSNGYIASFITDAGDPNLLEIPAGNWNFESYFSASSGGGSPTFYVELYKVNSGGTATLIASNSANPELISFGTTIAPYFSSLAVPTTVLALTDRLAVRYYVTPSGRTLTLHTEGPHLCQIITTFTTGLTALNGLTAQVQFFAVGTSGTDFNIASATATHTFNLPTASGTNRGALSSADWTTFNNKENAITAGTTAQYYRGDKTFQTLNTSVVPELTNLYYTEARVSANTDVAANTAARHNAVTLGTANGLSLSTQQLSLQLASGSQNGALSSTDWTTFNSKENAITAGTTAQYFRGDKTFQTLNTAAVPESGNLYFTNARAIASVLTGYTSGAGTISASDSILSAIQKLNGNIGSLVTGVSSVFGRTGAVIAANGDYYLGTTAIQAASANQGLTGITGITFVAQSTDSASITTTISGTSTFFDFNLSDDNLNDEWRWRFSPSGASDYNAMRLVPTTNTTSDLIVSGAISGSNLSGTNTGNVTLGTANGLSLSTQQLSLGLASAGVTGALSGTDWSTFNSKQQALNGTGFVKISGTTISYDNSTYYLASNPSAFIALTALSGTAPIQYNNTTGAISITQASGSTNGFLSSTDWTTFNNKQAALNGTGFVKISGTTISYDNSTYLTTAAAASTYVPYTGATSGVDIGTYTLSASNLIANGGFNAGALLLKQSSNAQTIFLGYTAITPVGNNTLNFGFSTGSGVWKSFTLSSFLLTDNINRTYTLPDASGTIALVGGTGVGTVTSVAALTLGTSGTDLSSSVANGTTTPVITLNVPTASATNRGALSAADWTTFNNKQNALTNPVTGTGTTGQVAYFNGTSSITGESNLFWDATNDRLGIGTATPLSFLDISSGTTSDIIRFGASSRWGFRRENNDNRYVAFYRGLSSTPSAVWTVDGDNGNLGLGVTPSAWGSSTFKVLDIGSTTSLYYDGGTILSENSFINSSFQYIYKTTNFASRYDQVSGQHIWLTAPSGTAGNAISFTQAMTLFSSGNLAVGPTSDAGFKLDVNGTGRFLSGSSSTIGLIVGGAGGAGSTRQGQLRFGDAGSVYKIQGGEDYSAFNFMIGSGTPLTITSSSNVGIGTPTPNSRLQVNGSLALPHTTKSANYTLTDSDYTVGFDCASNRTANLPDATTCAGRIYVIYQYNTGSGVRSVTLDGNGSQTINGSTTYSLSPYCDFSSVIIQSNGSNWIIIGSNFTANCL